MPPRSSTQVIESGEYLNSNFDANTLTMPHLLSIFTFHQVKFPVPYNKSKLVETFNEQIKPRADQFKRDRLKREGSVASSRGITDGLTGQSLSDDAQQPAEDEPRPPRRSSRRLSKPPEPVSPPEPPKRRRSSAGPTLSRVPTTTRRVEPSEPGIIEESEPEEEPVKKVGRPRKSVLSPGFQARKLAHAEEMEGWSDNNVFQSGAESSSPARPPPKTKNSIATRRATRRSRTSFSAPPQIPSSPSAFPAPSAAEFGPKIFLPQRSPAPSSSPLSFRVKTEPMSSFDIPEAQDEDEDDEDDEDDMVEPDEYQGLDIQDSQDLTDNISRALAEGRSMGGATSLSSSISILRLATYGLIIVVSIMVYSYKTKSATIGYCDSDKDTNDIVELRKASLNASEDCLRRLADVSESQDNSTCDPPPLFRFLEPLSCTPCPSHASCTPTTVTCHQSFIAHSHPVAQFPILTSLLNGLPGFGPVAFPPKCVEDEARKRRIGSIGAMLRHRLALLRGEKLCSGKGTSSIKNMHDAVKWGTTVDLIHDDLLRQLKNAPKRQGKMDEFDKIFKEAISSLEQYHEVTVYTDPETQTQYIASNSLELSLWCEIKLSAKKKWDEWKGYVFGSFIIFAVTVFIRRKHISDKADATRVAELVQIALDTLRNQEMAHHVDPVTAPHSHLSSVHLRDLILQDEHSIPARRRLWDKVEKIVEGNANVRAIIGELEGGDVGRLWQWVGNTAISSARSP